MFRRTFTIASAASLILFIATAVLCGIAFVSLGRPRPTLVPPATRPVARWRWFDRCIRHERWHAPLTVRRSYGWSSSPEERNAIIVSGRNVTYAVTSQPNGTVLVEQYDFWQFNLRTAAWYFVCLTAIAVVIRIKFRKSPRPEGFCPHCGYNLMGNVSGVCPECGTAVVRSAPDRPPSP